MATEFTLKMTDAVSAPANKAAAAVRGVDKASKEAAKGAKHAEDAFKNLNQAFAASGQGGAQLSGVMSKLGTLATALADPYTAVALAMGAVALGAVGVAVGLGALAYEAAKTALEIGETEARLVATFEALEGVSGAGERTLQMLDQMRRVTGMSTDSMAKYAEQLEVVGYSGARLEKAIKAVGEANALMGEKGASGVVHLLSRWEDMGGQLVKLDNRTMRMLRQAGVGAKDLAAKFHTTTTALKYMQVPASQLGDVLQEALEKKGAGAMHEFANQFSSIMDRWKESGKKLFAGANTQPFLQELGKLADMFSQDTVTGKFMNEVLVKGLNELFAAAAKVLPWIRINIKKFIIVALEAAIFIKKNWQTIKDVMKAVGIAIAVVAGILILTTAIALWPIAAVFVAITAAALLFVGAIWLIGKGVDKVEEWTKGLGKKLSSLKETFTAAAKDMIMGLIEGLVGGLAKLQKTATAVGDAVKDGVKSALKIQSPSKVMEQLGRYTGEGFNIGIKQSAGDGSAISSAAVNNAPAKSGGDSKGGMVLNIHPGAIVVQTGASAREVEDALEQNLTLMIERAAHAAGLG